MNTSDTLNKLVSDAFSGRQAAFRPCAFYDDRLDCIRVVARDCTVLEERVNERLTVLIDLHPQPGLKKYVGFTVKGAQHFCEEHRLNLATSVKVTQIADALLQSFPDPAVMMFVDLIAKSLVEDDKIEEVEVYEVPDDGLLATK
jgi:hypothetical protein